MKKTQLTALFLSVLMIVQIAPPSVLAEVVSQAVTFASNMEVQAESATPIYHTVNFYNYDHTLIKTAENVLDGTSRAGIEPSAPTREGYVFTGWSPTDEYILGDAPTTYDFVAQFQSVYVYEVTVAYRLDSDTGAVLADSFRGSYAYGEAFTAVSPTVAGYNTTASSVTGTAGISQSGATELHYSVIYTASHDTPYQVVHHFQNIDDDNYDSDTPEITQSLTATTSAAVTVYALAEGVRPDGFTPDVAEKTAVINADGSTRVDMYYARKEYQLNYNSNGGTYYPPFIARYGATVPALSPATPQKVGYTFAGWLPAIPATLTDNLTAEAQWTANSGIAYTLVYWIENANDTNYSYHSTATKNDGVSGALVPALSAADKKAITYFTYDHYDSTKTINADGSTIINVYYLRNSYRVIFMLNLVGAQLTINGVTYTGGSTQYSFTAKYEAYIADLWPSGINITGIDNKDWMCWQYNGSEFRGKQTVFKSNLFSTTGTAAYWGQWNTNLVRYQFHYMIALLSNPSSYAEELDRTTVLYTAQGTTFSNPMGIDGLTNTLTTNDSTTGGDGDYDVWFYYSRNSYTLEFYNYDGIDKTTSFKFGADISGQNYTPGKPAALAAGYTFGGWFTTSSAFPGTEFVWSGATMPPKDLTLYSKWIPPTTAYTITNKIQPVNGGALVAYASSNVAEGERGTRPADPAPVDYSAQGYLFSGWYYEGTNVLYSYDTLVYGNTNLYGIWVPRTDITYTVRYRDQGNEANVLASDLTVTNQTFGTTVAPNAEEIAGWYPDALSKSLTLSADQLVLTFWYSLNVAQYTVYYVESGTGLTLHEPKVVAPGDAGFPSEALATETALAITDIPYDIGGGDIVFIDFIPDLQQKSLLLSSDSAQSITFYYQKSTRYYYLVEYLEGDTDQSLAPDKKVRTTRTNTVETPLLIEGYSVSPPQISAALTHADTGTYENPQILTFRYDPRILTIEVTKIWNDENNRDGIRPASLPVTLTGSNGSSDSCTLTADDGWAHTYYLPKYASGALIAYTLAETLSGTDYALTQTVNPVNVDGIYTLSGSLTNTHAIATTSVTVNKVWADDSNRDGLRASYGVQLYADGSPVGSEIMLDAATQTYTWSNLPVKNAGTAIVYTVAETLVPSGYAAAVAGNAADGFTITNSHAPETLDISGTITWLGLVNTEEAPDVTITLLKDGALYQTTSLVNNTYSFTNLLKYEAGHPIQYEVQDAAVPSGYTGQSTANATNGKDFTNTYTASGTLNLSGTKAFTGREGNAADSFTFKLYSDTVSDGNLLETQTVTGGSGSFHFAPITYALDLEAVPAVNDLGSYTYQVIEEVPASNPSKGIVFDTTVYTVNVTVSDKGDGTLKVDVTNDNAASLDFNNIYEPYGAFDLGQTLNPTKVLAGRTLTAGEFSFELKQGQAVLQTVRNAADGAIPFVGLAYTRADIGHTYDYTISEVMPASPEGGMTYDPMVLAFSVEITDQGNGVLSAALTATPSDTVFNNSYAASGSFDLGQTLNPTKVLAGRTLTAGEFSFELKQGQAVLQTVRNAADGDIPFAALAYTQADIGHMYHYTISEVVPASPETGMMYDTLSLTFTVAVTDLGNGVLDAALAATPSDTVFNNRYMASGPFDLGQALNPAKGPDDGTVFAVRDCCE